VLEITKKYFSKIPVFAFFSQIQGGWGDFPGVAKANPPMSPFLNGDLMAVALI